MGLITEEVEITIRGNNVDYWENKGYYIPRYYNKLHNKMCFSNGTTIKVKTKDLPKYSKAKVLIKYDCCGIEKNIKYEDYATRNKDGKMYCNHCYSTLLLSGANHPHWRQDYSNNDRIERRYINGYYEFIRAVRERDNFVCQVCGKYIKNGRDGKVHHLNGYNWCEEGRMDFSNALYLCNNCHNNFHYQYGYGNNTKEQFEEWYDCTIKISNIGEIKLQTTKKVYCFETDTIYDSVVKCAEKLNVNQEGIRRCCIKICKSYQQYHFLYYDEYSSMSQSEIEDFLEWSHTNSSKVKIICLTTGEIFDSMVEGINKYNATKIGRCCKNQQKTSGVLNGTPLKWMYLSDFEKLSREEREKILDVKESEA